MTIELDLSHLHPFQLEFVQCTKPYQLFSGGAGIGKSEAAIIKMLAYVCQHRGAHVLYASSTWSTTINIFLPLLERSIALFPSWLCTHDKGKHRFRFWNGSIIYYRNLANPAGV